MSLLLAPPALLRLWAVRSGMPFFAAIVALVRFRAVILHMTLKRASIRVVVVDWSQAEFVLVPLSYTSCTLQALGSQNCCGLLGGS